MRRHLLVIGAQRCGTTSLYELLAAHPQIAMARPKRPEPKVFLSDELTGRGLSWYHSTFFAHAGPADVLGDKSTSYLEDARAAKRAAGLLEDVVIVVQLRDPLARAVSNWRFSFENGIERWPLEEALEQNLVATRGWDASATSVSPFAYLERGRYVDHLPPWFDCFPGSVHVRFMPDDNQQPSAAELFRAVGVDPDFEPNVVEYRVNQSPGEVPQLSNDLVERVRRYFQESDQELSALLGKAIPWRAP